jgi:uncharacterized protein
MIPRHIAHKLRYFSGKYPIVTLTGPRQSGKSTLLRSLFSDYTYISLEDPDILLLAKEDPRLFLQKYSDKTIIDEAQKFPELFSYLQTHVDSAGKEGMYILSGSHNFLLMERISQSLAGRTAILKLLPFSYSELSDARLAEKSLYKSIHKGFYPRIFDKDLSPEEFYPFYIQTYIEKDVRLFKNISDLQQFVRFLKMCAGRIGQLVNLSSLANECGISQPTAKAWLSILESSYVIYLLKPYYKNFNKRLTKSPKLYFYDTGLACSLLGVQSDDDLLTHFMKGPLFENLLIVDLIKKALNESKEPDLYFWRDHVGNEIDLLVEKGNHIEVVEFKSGSTYTPDFFKVFTYWEKLTGAGRDSMRVVYGGEDSMQTKHGALVSWKEFLNG